MVNSHFLTLDDWEMMWNPNRLEELSPGTTQKKINQELLLKDSLVMHKI